MKYYNIKSPNFQKKVRKMTEIRFIIIHYTGMQSKRVSLARLIDKKSKVSCHYLIDRKGKVIKMVDDNKVAWHAGKSKWKKYVNLNKYSLGIELVNKGHQYGYEKFTFSQINSLNEICKTLKKKYKIKKQNILAHSDIAPTRKKDPGEKFPWFKIGKNFLINSKKIKKVKEISKFKIRKLFFKNLYKIGYRYFNLNSHSKTDKFLVKAFQRKYVQNNVNGLIDQKTYEISHFIVKNSKI